MTVGAILGVAGFVVLLVAIGTSMLWAMGVHPGGLVRLLGLAQLSGLAALGTVLVVELSFGGRLDLATLLITAAALMLVSVGLGLSWRRRGPSDASVGGLGAAKKGWLTLSAALGFSAMFVEFEAHFRAARLSGLYEWDAMAFWVPKAEAIYYSGGLHGTYQTLDVPYYPPLLPAITASAFRLMGHVDPVTVHVLFAFVFLGFLTAVAGLLLPVVPNPLVWPFVLLVAVTPHVVTHARDPQADLTMDYFLALGALLLALWLVERRVPYIALATLMLAAATMTKREGLLLAVCLLFSALAATGRDRRKAWPPVVAAGVAVGLLSVPWRVWVATNGATGGSPESGYLGFVHHLDRAWPSLRLTIEVLVGHSWMPIAPLLALVLVAAAAAKRFTSVAVFAATFLGLGMLAASWVTVSFPSMPITTDESVNPIVRLCGGIVVPAAVLLPLLAHDVLGDVRGGLRPSWIPTWWTSRRAAIGLMAAVVVSYPVITLAVDGTPRFPSVADCSPLPTRDEPIDLVLGTYDSSLAAMAQLQRARHYGLAAQLIDDSCGQVKVAVPGYTTLAGVRSAVAEAQRVGIAATPEVAAGP